MANQELKDRIKELRLARGLSQVQLAAEVSRLEGTTSTLTRATVAQWENGATTPKHKRLQHVAEALGTTVPQLLGHSDNAPSSQPSESECDWPIQAITAEAYARLPKATQDRIEAFIAKAAGMPAPVDWRHTARSLAAAVDMQLRTDHHTQFVKALEQHFDQMSTNQQDNPDPSARSKKSRIART